MERSTFRIATRGSALALAQTHAVLAQCRAAFPGISFEIKIIKTTGDKLQTISLSAPQEGSTKGLFTKELEVALLNHEAEMAVHSLKDLPTELPDGLILGAVGVRADVRDVLIYRAATMASRGSGVGEGLGMSAHSGVKDFPAGAVIATSSTRRQVQLLDAHSGLKVVPIRGNVGTRLQKLIDQTELDGLILAAAGLSRLGVEVLEDGVLRGPGVPVGLLAVRLEPEEMLPCVGQGAVGIEIRAGDTETQRICEALNDSATRQCVMAERAFLRAMGGGCLSPVAAYGQLEGGRLRLRAVSFRDGRRRFTEGTALPEDAEELGGRLAVELSK